MKKYRIETHPYHGLYAKALRGPEYPIRQAEDGTWAAHIGFFPNAPEVALTVGSESPEAVLEILEVLHEEQQRKWAQEAEQRKAEKRATREAAAREQERIAHEATLPAKSAHATPRQVDFIMDLISQGRHLEGGWFIGPTTIEDVKKLSKSDASRYISSLLGEY